MTSASYASPSAREAFSTKPSNRLTPTPMFGAINSASDCAAVPSCARSSGENPVVPITNGAPRCWQCANKASVPAGRVKSTATSNTAVSI